MKHYPKAFEKWYSYHIHIQCLRNFQRNEYKQALYNAWKNGRRYQKTLAYVYGSIVRWSQ